MSTFNECTLLARSCTTPLNAAPCYNHMSSRLAQPSSRDFFYDELLVFVHLHYSLLGPIYNGWRVALERPLSPSTETERQEARKSPWLQITGCSVSKTNAQNQYSTSYFILGFLCMGMPSTFVRLWLQYIIQRVGSQREDQCSIIAASPEQHRRVKLATSA